MSSSRALFALAAAAALAPAAAFAHEHEDDHDDHGEEAAEVRQLDAHVHGAAELAAAFEDGTLLIELRSAMYNVVGFEYAPTTEEEETALAEAMAALEDGAALFVTTARAGCSLVEVDIVRTGPSEASYDEGHEGAAHEGEAHGHDDHDDAHEEHHDADHDDAGHDEAGHDDDDHDHDAHEEAHDEDPADAHAHEDDHGDAHEGEDHDAHADHDEAAEEAHDHGDHDAHADHGHRDVTATYAFHCERPDALRAIETTLFAQFPRLETVDAAYIDDTRQVFEALSAEDAVLNLDD